MSKDNLIVIKLSGSLFGLNTSKSLIKDYADLFKETKENTKIVIVAGGGKIARHYINLARLLGSDEATLDLIGIEVSRLNGRLLLAALDDYAYPIIPKDLEEVALASKSGKIVVTGGMHPGQSTNATAALICEKMKAAHFINATDVDGIYDSDPKSNPKAKLMNELTVSQCIEILSKGTTMAGTYDLMDIVALKVIERSKITTTVIKLSISNIKDIILENVVTGTKIIT